MHITLITQKAPREGAVGCASGYSIVACHLVTAYLAGATERRIGTFNANKLIIMVHWQLFGFQTYGPVIYHSASKHSNTRTLAEATYAN